MDEEAERGAIDRKARSDQTRGHRVRDGKLAQTFMVLVPCEDEAAQAALLERLQRDGYRCRALVS